MRSRKIIEIDYAVHHFRDARMLELVADGAQMPEIVSIHKDSGRFDAMTFIEIADALLEPLLSESDVRRCRRRFRPISSDCLWNICR